MGILLFFGHLSAFGAQPQQQAQRLLESLSLEQQIGQLLLVGFRGTRAEGNREIQEAISRAHVGSVILFDYDATSRTRGRNIQSPQQLLNLNTSLQRLSPIPLFISVDEEGGLVSRLHPRYGFRQKPRPAQLAQLSMSRARREMALLAQELRDHRINLNFAPLADVNVNPQNPVIGALGRSFSADPEEVTDLARAFIEEQNRQGVISVLKHFPGHGSSDRDSHLGVVDVTSSWIEEELAPYRRLISEQKVEMIMTAHIYQRHLDPLLPATLSPRILTDLLEVSWALMESSSLMI